jgi:hypothetical protein
MARQAIREMKKRVRAGTDGHASDEQRLHAKQAALLLLERSVRMGHRRLAVIRLQAAVSAGAAVPDEVWRYCHDAADASKDATVRDLYVSLKAAASAVSTAPTKGH